MVSDQDIQLLEMSLDRELGEAEAKGLATRLETEVELQKELTKLSEARKVRMLLWQSNEEPAMDVERLIQGLHAKQARRAWYVRLHDQRERIAAVAACIAVFLIGWQWGQNSNMVASLRGGSSSGIQPVSLITQSQVPSANGQQIFEVSITDKNGQVLDTKRFTSLQQAQQFIRATQLQLQSR